MWLLAAALPLQGLTAATMAACGVVHHGHTSTISQTGTTSDRSGMADMHVHGHDASSVAHRHAGASHSHPEKIDNAAGGGHQCSACASCCLNAVAPSEAISFETATLTHHFASPVTRALAAFVSEGLERPPRSFLA